MRAGDAEHYWIAARFERREGWDSSAYPFNCRSSAPLDELTFHPKVILVGETQFIIATHSPIILGYPDAWIYQTGGNGLERVEYEDTDRFHVTRNFLNHRQTLLDTLLSDD